jgi:hypothetical protein
LGQNEEITLPRPNAKDTWRIAGAELAAAASNKTENNAGKNRIGRIDDAQGKWNGTKKEMKRWNELDVFCCYNGLETFVAVS